MKASKTLSPYFFTGEERNFIYFDVSQKHYLLKGCSI